MHISLNRKELSHLNVMAKVHEKRLVTSQVSEYLGLIPDSAINLDFLLPPFSVWLRVRSRQLAGRWLRAPRFVIRKNSGHKIQVYGRVRYILLPLESYENFCFSIFTYGRGFPRPFCSFPSTMCLHMACFNKQKIEALKLKFSITFKRQQYIVLPMESCE